ncbi:MAG: hypothetical protein OEU90_02070 [Gammaproteobacteria bacterium]|nr:hypothetical protein [Gammaproteobacteria bacterium]MDH3750602.1 hypothetical protein [Gammaproteobacteria bacterium]MDH3804237.1 hypothetical protein [Gammaproteobacteria bacterium]
MTISRGTLFQFFKYSVYVFLAMNVYWFFAEEHLAARLQFPVGVSLLDMIEAYAATIDTAAWVVLLIMFELETYVLEDRQFTPTVTWTLHGLRAVCYGFIVYAFYGYIVNLVSAQAVTPLAGVSDLCLIVADQWSYAIDFDEYIEITAANCHALSSADSFLRFENIPAVVDAPGLAAIIGLAWIDVINAAVWLLVVLVLEVDVRLQEHNRYEGLALRTSTVIKVILYSTLLFAAVYWGIKGDFVDFWDALLWLVAFIFIELNVFDWRQEAHEELAAAGET